MNPPRTKKVIIVFYLFYYMNIFSVVPTGEAVVVGLSPSHFNYESMNVAFHKLLDGAKLVAIHQGRYYKTQKGLSLGPGPFVKALAFAADIKPEEVTVVGKPSTDFFMSALKSLDSTLCPEDAVMIGDVKFICSS